MTTHHHHTRPRSSFTTLSRALCALARSQFTRFVFLLGAIFLAVPSAHAVLRMNVQQVGNDVVVTASGSVNTAGLSFAFNTSWSAPALQNTAVQAGSGAIIQIYTGFNGPATIGPGPSGLGLLTSSATGPGVGMTLFNSRLYVPQGYVSGTAIGPSTATYAGKTLAGIGLTPGTYTYTWGSGPNADSAVVVVGSAPLLRYTYTGTITSFTPQTTGTYAITAYGAKGGNGSGNAGGTGARIAGDLALTSGESISVLVAGRGTDSGSTGSGGGGSYVVRGVQTALIVAGGGGGGAFSPSSNNNKDASTGLNGQNSLVYFNGQFGAAGGTAGSGGSSVGSGAGLLGNGGSFGGIAFVNGGLAGIGTLIGGFGGGGAVAGSAGGGGGGYSGGAGGSVGTTSGGGGSFNAGTNQSNTVAANPDGSGHGLVEIAGAFPGLTPGQTYTLTYVVNNTTDLLTALAAIDLAGSSSGPGLDYTIVFGNNITLTQQLWAINLDTGSSLTIEGNGRFLDGADTYNGFFVYNGKVAIKNLTIRNAKARGGNGGNAAISGGGGAGLGGGLFVTSSGNVTLSNASFSGNSAQGGNGGTQIAFGYGGGGGLLGGNGGGSNGVLFGAGGGGGVGANGGAPGQPGSAGLLLGAASGGAGAAGASGGASAGGGGGGSAAGNGLNATAGGGGVTSSSAGGFGGGGGGSLNAAGSGGFGGGGAGSGSYLMSGNGGFGGGSGGTAFVVGASAGFGGGSTTTITGGGGLGAGGNIFVQQGGTLTALAGTFSQGTVTGGTGTSPGSAFGDGIFIQGDQSITLGAPTGQTLAVQGVIADQTGSGGTAGKAGAGAVVIDGGTGTVRLAAANTYTGGTTLRAGTFQLASSGSAGSGTITFASASATLAIDAALSGNGTFANTLAGLAAGNRIDLTGTPFITGAEAQVSGSMIVLTNGTVTGAFNLAAPLGAGLGVKVSANSATGTLLTIVTVPSITLNPPSATIQGTSNLGATVTFSATAADATDGTVPVNFTEGGNPVTSGSTFAVGVHTLTATATNSLGGTTTQTFTFTVLFLPITPTPGRYIGSGSDALGAFNYAARGFGSGYITIGGLRYSFLAKFDGTTKTVNAKRTGFTSIPVTISALTGDGVHAQLRLSYTDPLSNQLVEVDISRTAYDSSNPCPHAGNWKVAFRNSAAVGAPTVSAVANVAITSTGSVRITGSTASRRVFMRGTVMIDPASIPFYMNCIRATTQTVQGTLNFAGDSATGDLRWVVPAGAEPDFANAIDEDYAAIGNRFTALPLAPQGGVFTLTNPGRTAGPVTGAATLQPTGMITGVPRVFALVSKGGGLSGFHIEAGVRTSFSGVYLPVNGEAIGFSRQGSNVGEVTFTPLR